MGERVRSGYPSDVTDEEWAFVSPHLVLCREDAAQRDYPLRDVFNGLRYIAKTGSQWRFMPSDLPPWEVVYQQMRRWIDARCFETMVEDLRILLREFAGRKGQPTAMILDSRTLQSTPESGTRGGYDGAKRRKGSKVHAAVDTLGHLLALHVTAADKQDRAQVEKLAEAVPCGRPRYVPAFPILPRLSIAPAMTCASRSRVSFVIMGPLGGPAFVPD
jgi:transposase